MQIIRESGVCVWWSSELDRLDLQNDFLSLLSWIDPCQVTMLRTTLATTQLAENEVWDVPEERRLCWLRREDQHRLNSTYVTYGGHC